MINQIFGKYPAIIRDVSDPEGLGRIRVSCPDIFGEGLSGWCVPNLSTSSDSGDFYIPPLNDCVWIEFQAGDITKPIYSGGWYSKDNLFVNMFGVSPEVRALRHKDFIFMFTENRSGIMTIQGDVGIMFEHTSEDERSSQITLTAGGRQLELDRAAIDKLIALLNQ